MQAIFKINGQSGPLVVSFVFNVPSHVMDYGCVEEPSLAATVSPAGPCSGLFCRARVHSYLVFSFPSSFQNFRM